MTVRRWTIPNMNMTYLEFVLLLIGIIHFTLIWGLKETECDVNLCNRDDSGFICEAGSVILIKEVMCRTGGQNCDEISYREVTRLCSGREICATSDLWLIHGKYCSHYNDDTDIVQDVDEFLSVVFVSYVCIAVAAVEGNCSESGIEVPADARYISSPGYPALITGSSACIWSIAAPPGYNVDVSVREYLLRDDPGKLFVKIRELTKGGLGMKFDRTAQKDLTFTLSGPIQILLFTHDSQRGHRMWIEYRLVQETTLEHLKLFPLPNRTRCGLSAMTTTTQIAMLNHSSGNNTSLLTNNTKKNATLNVSPDQSTTSTSMENGAHIIVEFTDTPSVIFANVTKTGIENKDPPNTGITIAVVVCTIGIACCLAAIWVMKKHRHHKAPGRAVNCLISDAYSLEYDRSSRSSTPATARVSHINTARLVGVPRPPLDMAEVMRQSEIIRQKKILRFSDDIEKVACESPPLSDCDDFTPIDFKKYIIADTVIDEISQCPDIENHV